MEVNKILKDEIEMMEKSFLKNVLYSYLSEKCKLKLL